MNIQCFQLRLALQCRKLKGKFNFILCADQHLTFSESRHPDHGFHILMGKKLLQRLPTADRWMEHPVISWIAKGKNLLFLTVPVTGFCFHKHRSRHHGMVKMHHAFSCRRLVVFGCILIAAAMPHVHCGLPFTMVKIQVSCIVCIEKKSCNSTIIIRKGAGPAIFILCSYKFNILAFQFLTFFLIGNHPDNLIVLIYFILNQIFIKGPGIVCHVLHGTVFQHNAVLTELPMIPEPFSHHGKLRF